MSTLDLSAGLVAIPQPKAVDLSAGLSLKSQPTTQPSIDLSSGLIPKPAYIREYEGMVARGVSPKEAGAYIGEQGRIEETAREADRALTDTSVLGRITRGAQFVHKPDEWSERASEAIGRFIERPEVEAGIVGAASGFGVQNPVVLGAIPGMTKDAAKMAAGMLANPTNWPFLLSGAGLLKTAVAPELQMAVNALFTAMQSKGAIDAIEQGDWQGAGINAGFALLGLSSLPGEVKTGLLSRLQEKARQVKPAMTRSFVEDPEAGVLRVGRGGLGKEPKSGINPAEVLASHKSTGGATFNPKAGDLRGSDAWAVSVYPELKQEIKGRDLTERDISDYLKRPEVKAALARGDLNLGTWAPKNENRHVLDISKTTPSVREALRIGRLNGQEEIYHLGREEGMKVHDPADLEMRARERFGLTKNPLEKAYLQPDGTRIRMEGSYDHRQIAELLGGEPDNSAIRNWGAQTGGIRIGTRIGRGGNEVYVSFHPDYPITPEQLEEIRATVGKLKNPNLYVEDVLGNKTGQKEMVRVGDVHNVLEQAGAQFEHPFDTEVRRTGVEPPGFYLLTTPEKDAAMKLLDSLPPHDEYVEAAKAGAVAGGWWSRSGKALDILFGKYAPLVKNLLASQSPQQPVTANLEMTLKTMEAWENAGRPTDIEGVTKVLSKIPGSGPNYVARFNNALRSLTGKAEIPGFKKQPAEGSPISGTKVSSMVANLNNLLNRTTLDSWMGLFGGAKEAKLGETMKAKQAKPSVDYVAHSVAVAKAAKPLDIPPAQAQEQIWAFTKTITELAGEKKPFEEVLRVLNDQDILREAQDFSDMVLKNENIQSKLKALGIDTGDPELQGRLRALSEERPKPGEGPVSGRRADPEILARIARRLESTRREAGGAAAVLRKKGEPEGGLIPGEGEAAPKVEPPKGGAPPEEKNPLLQKVEGIWGTDQILGKENAGWLTPEGKITAQDDVEGSPEGHARVAIAYSPEELKKIGGKEKIGGYHSVVVDFANQTGAMRVSRSGDGGLFVQVSKDHPPSDAQLQWLRREIKENQPGYLGIESIDLSKVFSKESGVLPGDVDRAMAEIYGKEAPFGKGLEEEKLAEGRQPGEEGAESAESLLSKAEKIFPPVPDPPERSFITPEGTYLSADDADHFAVSQLYDGLEDEAAIVEFLNDTGAVRTLFDGESFLVHLGDKEPTPAQMDSILRSFREYEESITSSIRIERQGYSKDFSDKKLDPGARPIDVRRAIESVYEKKAEPVSLEAGFVPKPEGLAEKTDYKTEAEKLGIEFRGVQESVGEHPGLAIFQDPKSGTSIAVRLDEWSPEKLQEHLEAARERMGVSESPAAINKLEKRLREKFSVTPNSADITESAFPGLIFKNGDHISIEEAAHFEMAEAAYRKQGAEIDQLLEDTGAMRLVNPDEMDKGEIGVEVHVRPSEEQVRQLAKLSKSRDADILWDIRTPEGKFQSGSGSIGEFQRAVDKAYPLEAAREGMGVSESPAAINQSEKRLRENVNSAPPAETPKLIPEKIAGGKVSVPAPTYHEASSTEGNPWVRRSADPERSAAPENKDRLLMVQFSSELLAKGLPKDTGGDYYDKLYGGARPGYARLRDFWEIPQWMGFMSHIFPDADVYVVRDMAEAKKFLNEAGYGRVAFSALDTNKVMIKELAKGYKGKFDVGGYTAPGTFLDTPNVRWHDSIESMAKAAGVDYKEGTDYRHFEGSDVIPRLTMSDGCLHKCAFCVVEKKIDVTPEQVVNQQVDSISKLGAKLVYLNDKTFGQAPNYKQLSDIYARMKEKNPDFHGFIVQTTAAQMVKIPEDWLAKSGIKYVELGIESYNDPILKAMHKPATESLINQAVDKLRKNNIALIPNILIGYPGETAATYERTLKFLKDNADIISHANIYNLAIYENTELAKKITTASPGDFNENVLEKSFHSDPAIHQQFAGDLYGIAQDLLDKKPGEKLPMMKGTPGAPRDIPALPAEGVKGKALLEFKLAGPAKHEDFLSAVANTPGAKVEGRTLSVDAVRYQTPEQAGERAVRTGVFFLPEKKSPYAVYYTPPRGGTVSGSGWYGGSMKVEGPLSIENPIVSRSATGGAAPAIAYDALKGKGAYEKMRNDVLSSTIGKINKISKVADILKKYGGDPEMAEEIVLVSKKGNQLPYAIQEHIVASAVRDAGHGGIVGYTKYKGQWRLSEVFDVRRKQYPTGLPSDFVNKPKELSEEKPAPVKTKPSILGLVPFIAVGIGGSEDDNTNIQSIRNMDVKEMAQKLMRMVAGSRAKKSVPANPSSVSFSRKRSTEAMPAAQSALAGQ